MKQVVWFYTIYGLLCGETWQPMNVTIMSIDNCIMYLPGVAILCRIRVHACT